MKLSYVRFVSALVALAALAVAGRAQEPDQLIVKVPYQFVVAGKTLPAGTYKVLRANDNDLAELEMISVENHSGVLLLSSEISSTNEDKPSVRFERVGDQYFLSRIETANHIFTISVPKNAAALVAAKSPSSPSTAGSSGAN